MAVLLHLGAQRIELGLHRALAVLDQRVQVLLGFALHRNLRQDVHYHPSTAKPLPLVVDEAILGHDDRLHDRLRVDGHVERALLERKQRVLVVAGALREDGQFELEKEKKAIV